MIVPVSFTNCVVGKVGVETDGIFCHLACMNFILDETSKHTFAHARKNADRTFNKFVPY
jgi:hypothetical protein